MIRAKWIPNKAGRPMDTHGNDCVIRAFAIHQRWPYSHAERVIESLADMPPVSENGMTLDRVWQLAKALGLAEITFATDVPLVMIAERLQDAIVMLNCTPAHTVAVRDGNVHDEWDSRFVDTDPSILTFAHTAWISPFPRPGVKSIKAGQK